MKNIFGITLLAAGIFAFTPSIQAQDFPSAEGGEVRETEVQQRGGWEIGTEVSHISYREPGVMRERGLMYGISTSYTHHTNNKFMLKADGKFSYGRVKYKGSGDMSGINDYILEARGLVGYDLSVSEGTTGIFYTGFGYRYLYDAFAGTTSTGALGYDRESNYYYSPFGIDVETAINDNWSAGLVAEYDLFWFGVQKTHLEDAHPSLNTVKNDQKSGYGLRGSIRLQKKGEKVDYVIEPFIKYWNISDSDFAKVTFAGTTIATGWEPKNNSTEIGCKLAVRF